MYSELVNVKVSAVGFIEPATTERFSKDFWQKRQKAKWLEELSKSQGPLTESFMRIWSYSSSFFFFPFSPSMLSTPWPLYKLTVKEFSAEKKIWQAYIVGSDRTKSNQISIIYLSLLGEKNLQVCNKFQLLDPIFTPCVIPTEFATDCSGCVNVNIPC